MCMDLLTADGKRPVSSLGLMSYSCRLQGWLPSYRFVLTAAWRWLSDAFTRKQHFGYSAPDQARYIQFRASSSSPRAELGHVCLLYPSDNVL